MGNTETFIKFDELEFERSKSQVHQDWNVVSGSLRSAPVTVFSAGHPSSSKKRPFMEKALQASRIYRHPNILRYLDGGLLGNEIVVITEEATPLQACGIDSMSLLQITAGLASVMEALVFLHDNAGVSHNNVCSASIYVTSEGVWKLWGLEYLCSFGDLNRAHVERINQYCSERTIPPDDQNRISPAYQHARDAYSFATFVLDTVAHKINENDIGSSFLSFLRSSGCHIDAGKRPRISSLLEHSLFKHEFLQLRKDIANVLLLPADQRDQFIKSLPTTLKQYCDNAVASTLSSMLISHSFLLIPSAAEYLMPDLLTPKTSADCCVGVFSEDLFICWIIPLLLPLFNVRDSAVRKVLLAHFDQYATLIEKDKLANDVLPELLLGIRDKDDTLVAMTLRALAFLVPILGANVVVGKNRQQIFTSAKPKTKCISTMHLIKTKKIMTPPKPSVKLDPSIVRPISVDSCPPLQPSSAIPPERSEPDGGETQEEVQKEEEQWSDWDEKEISRSPLNSVGDFLLVKPLDDFDIKVKTNSYDSSEDTKDFNTGKGVKLKAKNGLGEEFDIMNIEIQPKKDAERDLFADIAPDVLNSKSQNLEDMLEEASIRLHRKSVDSDKGIATLSETLAAMVDNDIGEGWNDEGDVFVNDQKEIVNDD